MIPNSRLECDGTKSFVDDLKLGRGDVNIRAVFHCEVLNLIPIWRGGLSTRCSYPRTHLFFKFYRIYFDLMEYLCTDRYIVQLIALFKLIMFWDTYNMYTHIFFSFIGIVARYRKVFFFKCVYTRSRNTNSSWIQNLYHKEFFLKYVCILGLEIQ